MNPGILFNHLFYFKLDFDLFDFVLLSLLSKQKESQNEFYQYNWEDYLFIHSFTPSLNPHLKEKLCS